MPKDPRKASEFFELVYDSQLLQFIGKVSSAILIDDGTEMHQIEHLKNGENYTS